MDCYLLNFGVFPLLELLLCRFVLLDYAEGILQGGGGEDEGQSLELKELKLLILFFTM